MPTESMSGGVFFPTPRPDDLAVAEESLLAKRDSLAKQIVAVDKMIENLRDLRSGAGEKPIPPVRPDEYRGMRAVDALEVYFRAPARRDLKIPLSRAVSDLVVGGVDPGQSRGKQSVPSALISHTLKIALPNKTDIFQWSPEGFLKGVKDDQILVWLAESADMPRRRKRGKKSTAKAS